MQRCLIRGVTLLALGLMPAIDPLAAMSTGSAEPAASARSSNALTSHVRAIAQDAKGQMWFGTDGEGLVRYDGHAFTFFTEKEGLPSNFVRTIDVDAEGKLWITSRDGLCTFDGTTFTRATVPTAAPTGDDAFEMRPPGPDALFFPAGPGAAVAEAGELRFLPLPINEADRTERNAYQSLMPYDVYTVHRDRTGVIWMGTASRGVCRLDGKSARWFREHDLDKAAVRAIFVDEKGHAWFGNSGVGLFRFDGTTLVNFGVERKVSNLTWLQGALIRQPGTIADPHAITSDRHGTLWIGAFDSGVWRLDGDRLQNFTTADGLPVDSVSSIHEDASGTLWFGTFRGVRRFNGTRFSPAGSP
ncbi:MAG TPA: two-component regulator propeller domain-containing protein [Phycisphaerales bacterium]